MCAKSSSTQIATLHFCITELLFYCTSLFDTILNAPSSCVVFCDMLEPTNSKLTTRNIKSWLRQASQRSIPICRGSVEKQIKF